MNDKTLLKKLQAICDKVEATQDKHNEEMDALYKQVADLYETIYNKTCQGKAKK